MPSPRIAVDTNFLIDLAEPKDMAADAFEIVRQRVAEAQLIATPTVVDELGRAAADTSNRPRAELAIKALESLLTDRAMQLAEFSDVQITVAKSLAQKLLGAGSLPTEERHDALILAEAAVTGCDLLVSADSHLRDIDRTRLALLLKTCDVGNVVVCTPARRDRRSVGRTTAVTHSGGRADDGENGDAICALSAPWRTSGGGGTEKNRPPAKPPFA